MAHHAVLVHGGFHGGWCWRRVADPLRRTGWIVHTPSLTGLADRSHQLTERVTQDDRINDIIGVIESEELDNVILCGHSAGGMIVTGVAERIPERIGHLVYLDAVVPTDGQTLLDVVTNAEGLADSYRQHALDGWRLASTSFSAEDFGVTDVADQAWVERRMTDDSLTVWETPLSVGPGWASVLGKTFVRAERFPMSFHDALYARFAADPAWETQTWDVGHDVMIETPDRVIDLLSEIAARSERPVAAKTATSS